MKSAKLLSRPLPARAFGWAVPRRVGLLGGSFNPAHAGHLYISELALKLLGLDEVWWLVSPQNPLKPAKGMAPLAKRLEEARRQARHPKLRVTAIEADLGTRYTADTLATLCARYPRIRFVWLMGADNLRQIEHWRAWSSIFHLMPIAVFARHTYDSRALAGKAASRFRKYRRHLHRAGRFSSKTPPAWAFVHSRLHPASGTAIRSGDAPPRWTRAD
jgi:nicotinate-nucleotide adenylyltransferase